MQTAKQPDRERDLEARRAYTRQRAFASHAPVSATDLEYARNHLEWGVREGICLECERRFPRLYRHVNVHGSERQYREKFEIPEEFTLISDSERLNMSASHAAQFSGEHGVKRRQALREKLTGRPRPERRDRIASWPIVRCLTSGLSRSRIQYRFYM